MWRAMSVMSDLTNGGDDMNARRENAAWIAPDRAGSPVSELRVSGLVGFLIWIGLAWAGTAWTEWLLLLAPLTVVPLGIAATWPDQTQVGVPLRLAARLQPAASALAAAAFLLPEGATAVVLTVPWLAFAALAAFAAAVRLWRRAALGGRLFEGRNLQLLDDGLVTAWRRRKAALDWVFRARAEETVIDGGWIYLAVGATWLSCQRAGWTPLGFPEVIVLLTAVHFHYAGFAAPVLAGLTGRLLKRRALPAWRLFPPVALALLAGSLVVAAGHLWSPALELAGAWTLSAALVLTSSMVLFGGALPSAGPARTLAVVSALAPPASMALAIVYAWGVASGSPLISIPEMALWHGGLNAFAYALAGMAACSLEEYSSQRARAV